jgi:uncharacterized protein
MRRVVEYEWDEAKRRSNLAKHGVDFAAIVEFDWARAVMLEDRRRPYGERRWLALAELGDRVHTVIFTERHGRKRLISMRKSKRKEVEIYEQASRAADS